MTFVSLISFSSDRHSGASPEVQKEEEKKFKEVGEAFSVLSDAKKKSRYDSGQDLEDDGMNMGGQYRRKPPGWEVPRVNRADELAFYYETAVVIMLRSWLMLTLFVSTRF